jgi:hypothetical protein
MVLTYGDKIIVTALQEDSAVTVCLASKWGFSLMYATTEYTLILSTRFESWMWHVAFRLCLRCVQYES